MRTRDLKTVAAINSLRETGISMIYTSVVFVLWIWNIYDFRIWRYTGIRVFDLNYAFCRFVF